MLLVIIMIIAVLPISSPVSAQSSWSLTDVDVSEYTDDEYMQKKLTETFNAMPSSFLGPDGNSLEFGGATGCLGYARWAFYQLFGLYDNKGDNTPGYFHKYSFDNNTIKPVTTPEELRSEFSQLNVKLGSMVCYFYTSGSQSDHSMIYLKSTDDGMYFLHANWCGNCNVLISFFTWEDMMNYFGQPAVIEVPWDYPGETPVYTSSLKMMGKDGVYVGERSKYSLLVKPENVSVKGVVWNVNNITGEAVIDSCGNLTAIKPGLVTVTATARDGSGYSASKTVKLCKNFDIINACALLRNDDSIVLRWDVCSIADGYCVYTSDDPAGDFELAATCTSGDVNSISLPLTSGMHSYYKVCAYRMIAGKIHYGTQCSFFAVNTENSIPAATPYLPSQSVSIMNGFIINDIL